MSLSEGALIQMKQKVSNVLRIMVFLLLIVGAISLTGLRIAHPHSGLQSALGPAKSSLVIYKKAAVVSVHGKVIVNTGDKKSDPALAIVNNVKGDDLDIQAGSNLVRVSIKKDLYGRLVIVIPFIGYIANLFGV